MPTFQVVLRQPTATNSSTSILPALAFSLDMFTKTNMSFGVNEVLLASVLGSVVFSVFAAQPLTIVGVTGTNSFTFLRRGASLTRRQGQLPSSITLYTT